MSTPNEAVEKDRGGKSQWKDGKSYVGFYCDPSVKERLEIVAEATNQSISETARRRLNKALPRL
jgi:hypothetical protein